MRKRVAQRIRASILKGTRDGSREYDPDLQFSNPFYFDKPLDHYQVKAYDRAYATANRKLVEAMTDEELEQAKEDYRREFMTPEERQHEDLMRDLHAIQSSISTLQAQVNRLEHA